MNKCLSTYNALRILKDELKSVLKRNYVERNLFHYFMSLDKGIFKEFLIANIFLFFIIIMELFYGIIIIKPTNFWKIFLYCNILLIIIINCIIISRDKKHRYASIYQKLQLIIEDIEHVLENNCKGWLSAGNYPFVKIPFANSVNLQWSIRDNQLINLPVALLVKGDTIRLRPGQYIFADCELNSDSCEKNNYRKIYTIGQTFVSDQDNEKSEEININEKCNHKVIPMKSCVTAIVTKTPIIDLIDEFLVSHFKKDAWVITVPERYIQFSANALLIFLFVAFILNLLCYIGWLALIKRSSNMPWPTGISEILLIGVPIHLPLLLFITLSNITWKINFLRYKLDKRATLISNTVSMERIPSSVSLNSNDSDHSIDVTMESINVSVMECLRGHWHYMNSQDFQFVKMIYSMASLTSLCCVDKKGILADPIATPEKIFIYRKRHRHKSNSLINLNRSTVKSSRDQNNPLDINSNSPFDFLTNSRLRSMTTEHTITSLDLNTNRRNKFRKCVQNLVNAHFKTERINSVVDINCSLSIPVILDMTRSNIYPYLPNFDDNRWERYLTSLKPIGLNILLNNCNPDVTDRYINFTDNMSAINFKNLNKSQLTHRCICALATQIGFKQTATERFTLESTFAVCRINEKFLENNVTLNSQVNAIPPVGNVFSTIVRDPIKNNYQLMSQGSADLLMTMCSDYWDGKDISPLSAFDRSRILDFYNRNIFSSYCIGFSYSPLFNKIKFNDLDDQFILQISDMKDKLVDFNAKVSNFKRECRNSLSTDNLYAAGSHSKKTTDSLSKLIDDENLLKSEEVKCLLKHQIFLGMISLQADQVQSDVIDCINRLEQACIRFVFFSTDNQLRSRVFAERLGMESGWNCHISLADPAESDDQVFCNVRRSSSKFTKKNIPEEVLNEDFLGKKLSFSEPILHRTNYQSDQITHSITLNDKKLLVNTTNIGNQELTSSKTIDLEDSKVCDDTSTITSVTSESKRQTSFLENPQDHFPEDKSKLPCGIKSIRPHLEKVDNVPLQVSLFTDCNPGVDNEMMSIMREYGEVICCCGSGLTVKNVPLFSSNDCAVAFVPILHKQCWRQHDTKSFEAPILSKSCQLNKNQRLILEEEPMVKKKFTFMDQKICLPELSPVNIACRLVALPCGLLLNRKTGFNLITFITECHRLVKNTLQSVAFYCLSCASYALLKILLNIVILLFDFNYNGHNFHFGLDTFPTDCQIIYLLYFHAPVLALIIYFRSCMQGKPLKEPPRKRGRLLTYKQCYRFVLASFGRFLPSVLLCIISLIWNIITLCHINSNICVTMSGSDLSDFDRGNIYGLHFHGYWTYANISCELHLPFRTVKMYCQCTRNKENIGITKLAILNFGIYNQTLNNSLDNSQFFQSVIGDYIFIQQNIYIVTISFFYITPDKPFWKFNCLKNFQWLLVAIILVALQFFYFIISWRTQSDSDMYIHIMKGLYSSLIFSVCGVLIILFFGFIATNWEIKALSVEHRLTRLYFGTKLGMYSPV